MDLRYYVTPLLKWWWLLVGATLVATISSFFATRRQPPLYQSRTTLMVGNPISDPNPSSVDFSLGLQLAAAYADIAKREQLQNAVKDVLNLPFLPAYEAKVVPRAQIIEIIVTDIVPERAQAVAAVMAEQLILMSPTTGQGGQERQEFINAQLDELEKQITETKAEIERLQQEIGKLNSAREIATTQAQIAGLQTKSSTLQSNYANLLANTQEGALNTLAILEPAGLPQRPIRSNANISVLLTAGIAFSLASGAAYLLEYLNETLEDPKDIERMLPYQTLGYIPEMEESVDNKWWYVAEVPRSPISQAFRSLRTNIEFTKTSEPIKTILISSPAEGEGKTTIATNLAISMANKKKKVVVIDADLYRPKIHEFFGMPVQPGLSEILEGKVVVSDIFQYSPSKRLHVIPTGKPKITTTELLGSKRYHELMDSIKSQVDVVIIDAPPFFLAEASEMASYADGIVVVVRPGYTSKKMARAMREQIEKSRANVLGLVLNRVTVGQSRYYGYYYTMGKQYYAADFADLETKPARKAGAIPEKTVSDVPSDFVWEPKQAALETDEIVK